MTIKILILRCMPKQMIRKDKSLEYQRCISLNCTSNISLNYTSNSLVNTFINTDDQFFHTRKQKQFFSKLPITWILHLRLSQTHSYNVYQASYLWVMIPTVFHPNAESLPQADTNFVFSRGGTLSQDFIMSQAVKPMATEGTICKVKTYIRCLKYLSMLLENNSHP